MDSNCRTIFTPSGACRLTTATLRVDGGQSSRFVRNLSRAGVSVLRNDRGEALVWQRRFWEHTIGDEDDCERHVEYIHFNPVKHDLVSRPADWPYSTFHRFVARGDLDPEWAGPTENVDWPACGEPK